MPFSRRSVNAALSRIIKLNGRQVACYQRLTLPNPPRVPTDIYADTSSPDSSNVKLYYIFAVFEQKVQQDPASESGLRGLVTGCLTIPYQYRDIVNKTEYFDPYLNGSKFIKDGVTIDDHSLLIMQNVKSLYLPEMGWTQ